MKRPSNKVSFVLYLLAFVFITLLIGLSTGYSGYNNPQSRMADNFRLSFIVFNLMIIVRFMGFVVSNQALAKGRNMLVSVLSLLFILFILEGVFMFVPKSYGRGDPNNLAERIWFSKYWQVNKLGYRDIEIDPESDQNKFKIAILGDSFVAGHGIKDVNDRFSNILGSRLGSDYRIYNMGLNGADTQAEFDKLVTFPIKPNLIILVHYPNDIKRVPDRTGESAYIDNKINRVNAQLLNLSLSKGLVENSYLINYFYYKFESAGKIFPNSHRVKTTKEHLLEDRNRDNYKSFYLREEMFREHLQNLYRFIALTQREGIPFMVMLIPETWDETIDYSGEYVNKPIASFFSGKGIPVLDLYTLLKQIPVEDRVVNNQDSHLSVESNRQIADKLYDYLKNSDLINN